MTAMTQLSLHPAGGGCRPECRTPSPSECHCSTCHRTLRSISEFDLHRRDGRCVSPRSLGFVEAEGVWSARRVGTAAEHRDLGRKDTSSVREPSGSLTPQVGPQRETA